MCHSKKGLGVEQRIYFWAQDPLFRGFFLLSCLLLGVGLEQSLLHTPSAAWELSFLAGNFLGLFVGLYLWDKTRIYAHLPLRLWSLEGLLVGLLVWKQNPVLAFILGLFFGPLVLHLFLLSTGRTFKYTLLRVGAGIISGNIFLFILGYLPKDLALVLLALSMVGWRVLKEKLLPLKKPRQKKIPDPRLFFLKEKERFTGSFCKIKNSKKLPKSLVWL